MAARQIPAAFLAGVTVHSALDLVNLNFYLVLDLTKQGGIGS